MIIKEFTKECRDLGLTPNEYIVLHYLFENNIKSLMNLIPNPYDDYRMLAAKGYIEYNEEKNKIKLTDLTKQHFSEEAGFDEFVASYRQLFSDTGKTGAMGDKKGCEKKMKAFMKKYPEYSKVTILKATEFYIDSVNDKKYLSQADYCIEKHGVSKLGAFCELVQNGQGLDKQDVFTIKA